MTIDRNSRILFFFALFAFCFIIMVMRRPDLISNPQFWAEDGKIWYAQAHNLGWFNSIILPQNGYYQTISKLTAAISLNFSLASAPLVMNIIAISIRCTLVLFLMSNRVSCLSFLNRAIISAFILFMPHLEEVHANITNTHWYLSTYLFFILISDRAESNLWKGHDILVMVISGLSGPFIVFLAPILALRMLSESNGVGFVDKATNAIKKISLFEVIFGIICLIQLCTILISQSGDRSAAPLGASIPMLANILSSRVFIGFLTSEKQSLHLWDQQNLNYLISVAGCLVLIFLLIKGNWKEKSAVIFPFLMLFAALAKPMIHLELPQWPRIQFGAGQRYFVITSIFWVTCILFSVQHLSNHLRITCTFLLALFIAISGYQNFNIHKLPDNRWDKEVVKYNDTPSGKRVILDINPKGWKIDLIK
ncbi:glucosyl transferase [Escherichia coli]|uniref:glucosyl transferase n=1 Tax=Escherichia coli TaxID=562 RepID=UPI0018E0D935|nr:glucosyl transferase [Escherichia coli]EHI1107471.1 glucosyl transferase [Escherichia coli]MBI1472996.1 glucosyl transferase [Escherichia coli]MBI1482342.1 glucosyl transferase [Escherichia coli]MBI1487143.1 glucosyl transferase [Escherichia coli]